MPKVFLSITLFFLSASLLFLLAYPSKIKADENPGSDITSFCSLAPDPNPIIFDEDFYLRAQTDSNHIFKSSNAPYTAKIAYGIPITEEVLGNMKLAHDGSDDSPECKCVRRDKDTDECERWVEIDTCDQQDSRNLISGVNITSGEVECNSAAQVCRAGDAPFRFNKFDGPVIVEVYDRNNTLVCFQNTTVELKHSITISVKQPLKVGDTVTISGVVRDHFVPVPNVNVDITINNRKVQTKTDASGSYKYNNDTTLGWGLDEKQFYTARASTNVAGEKIDATKQFGVDVAGLQIAQLHNLGQFSTVTLSRFYNSQTKDYWSSTALEVSSTPEGYYLEGPQVDLVADLKLGATDLTAFYDCTEATDHFASTDAISCQKGVRLGYVYTKPIDGSVPLYICKNNAGERMVSTASDCRDKPNVPSDYKPISTTPLAYALPASNPCPVDDTRDYPVTASYSDDDSRAANLLLRNQSPLQISESIENQPKKKISIGVSQDWLRSILPSFFSGILCSLFNLYCPQTLAIGESGDTQRLLGLTGAIFNSNNPSARSIPKPGDEKNLKDTHPCETGDKTADQISGLIGTGGGYYTAGSLIPDMPLKLNPEAKLRQSQTFNDERSDDWCSRRDLFFKSNFPPGVLPVGFRWCDPAHGQTPTPIPTP